MNVTSLNKSEEKLRWRQQDEQRENDGETTAKSSTILSRQYKYIMLAASPPRPSAAINEESDTSTYDNIFHSRETDICRDSSDSDSSSGNSFTTEEIATVEVVEYEVASASDDDHSFVNNSSSGTDEHGFIMTAAVAARAVYESTSSTSEFADSEESDSDKLFDSELTPADYWKCIQCKNSQNSPLFRMCEKCYKTRRTHFPPRPKFRKKRLNRNRKTATVSYRAQHSPSLTTELSSYTNSPVTAVTAAASTAKDNDEMSKRLNNNSIGNNDGLKTNFVGNNYKKRKLNYTNNNTSQLNSAAETSGDDSSDVDHRNKHVGNRKRKSPLRIKRDNVSTNQSSSGQSNLSANRLENSLSRKRKSSSNDQRIENEAKHLRLVDSSMSAINKIDTASDTDDPPLTIIVKDSQKDSGLSSANSSQEPTSSSLSDERSIEYLRRCTPENVCNELDAKNSIELQNVENISQQSTSSSVAVGSVSNLTLEKNYPNLNDANLIRSVSDCSSSFLSNNLAAEAFTMNVNSLDSNFSSYGSCIICLSGPKNGVFVHSKFLHLCSCYKCAVKIWSKYKRCPVCNSSVKNVLKLFVH